MAFSSPPVSVNDSISVAMTVTSPALPTSISNMTTRRRTGWPTTASAPPVVNPVPDSAERAWKRAASCESPVSTSATVATRAMSSETMTTTRTVASATILLEYPP